MGQYHFAVNLDKEEVFSAHDCKDESDRFGHGVKLLEHSYIENSYMGAIMHLLQNEWKGDRIAWIGDYYDSGEIEGIPSWNEMLGDDDNEGHFVKVSHKPKVVATGFLNNHTLGVSIDLSKTELTEMGDDWKLHPLPLLTAVSNGRGGGDYNVDNEFSEKHVGTWAGHEFSYTPKKPKFKLIPFNERMSHPNSVDLIQNG